MLDCDPDAAASIINRVVDFLEDEEKTTDLLSAWNMFVATTCPRPHHLTGASTDNVRFANGRVVGASLRERTPAPRHARRADWDRVAQGAERCATFPPLRVTLQQQRSQSHRTAPPYAPQPPTTGPTPGVRKRARKTARSAFASSVGAGGCGSSSSSTTTTVPTMSQGGEPQPAPPPQAPGLTDAAFPKCCRTRRHPGHTQSSLWACRISSEVRHRRRLCGHPDAQRRMRQWGERGRRSGSACRQAGRKEAEGRCWFLGRTALLVWVGSWRWPTLLKSLFMRADAAECTLQYGYHFGCSSCICGAEIICGALSDTPR